MNLLTRLFFKKVIRNIFESNNLMLDNTKIKAKWFSDGFLIKNIKLKMSRDDLEGKILPIINCQDAANFNCIKVKGQNLEISVEDYFSSKHSQITKSDMSSPAKPWDFITEIKNSNTMLIVGSSGSGKTTLLKEILAPLSKDYEALIYSLKPEDFPEGGCKGFEPENLKELEEFLRNLKENRSETMKPRLLVIDEFFFLGKIKIGEEIHKHLADMLPYMRSSNFKAIVLSQSLAKARSKNFDIDLCNLKLINLPDIKNYTESLGYTPQKFLAIKLVRGQFIKFSLLESPQIITHSINPK